MQGYWKAAELTAETVKDGWLHTGDMGHLDADGYIYITDRKKDLIIRGGFNVYPRDVEDVLLEHPAVSVAAVVGRPDPVRRQGEMGIVSLRPAGRGRGDELVEFSRERLGADKAPREVRV